MARRHAELGLPMQDEVDRGGGAPSESGTSPDPRPAATARVPLPEGLAPGTNVKFQIYMNKTSADAFAINTKDWPKVFCQEGGAWRPYCKPAPEPIAVQAYPSNLRSQLHALAEGKSNRIPKYWQRASISKRE